MDGDDPNENGSDSERIWPGAVEAGLQKPVVSPTVIDLRDDAEQTWMNQSAAEREKGAPLTDVERQRVIEGRAWNESADGASPNEGKRDPAAVDIDRHRSS